MPSPFPGMDPWLENPSEWGGFHQAFVVAVQAELNRHLPVGFRAKIDEYVWVRDDPADDDEHPPRFKPDTFVPEPSHPSPGVATASRPTTSPDVHGRLRGGKRRRNRYVSVVDSGKRVWTAIEVLSRSNKTPGEDRDAYLRKRKEFLASVNLVEIDLLRAGLRVPTGNAEVATADYLMVCCLADKYPEFDAWTVSVRDPLPVLPIPLTPEHPACPLDLRACLDRVYDETRVGPDLKYTAPPTPRLRKADAEWAAEWLAKTAPPNPKGG